jgi:hypothetical protein
MCQLDDDHPSITFTAAATVTVDDKSYTFSSWQGCTEQDTTARSCSVAVVAGTTLPIKALYSPSEITDSKQPGGTTQAVAPYIVVTMNDQAFDSRSTPPNTAFYVPRITTGNKTADVPLGIAANGLELSRCTITDNVTLDDATFSKQQVSLPSIAKQTLKLVDGSHAIVFDCPTTSSSNVTLSITGLAADGLAKKCADYNFTDSSSTANNLDELKSAVVGSWAGCVTTPWTPSYYVNISFKADGTYTATSTESLDGIVHTPMYWGGQQTNAKSTYRLMTFASGVGTGEFVIYFSDAGTTTQDTLKYVKVMGDKLSFEFMHFSAYGPVTYKLYRQ